MKYRLLCLNLLLLFALNARAGAVRLTADSRVSILTCDPGREPYAIFGHSAIRIQDSTAGVDIVYNYGTFNFDDLHFYKNFLGGDLNYYLGTAPFDEFMEEYAEGHRAVVEQVLNLDLYERQRLYDHLEENAREENKYYKYNFFYDNCSTKIRDDLEGMFKGNYELSDPSHARNQSFRQLISKYFSNNPWAGFGIDICLGLPADRPASLEERMFLPLNLSGAMDHFSVAHGRKLVADTEVYDFKIRFQRLSWDRLTSPTVIFWIIFAFCLIIILFEMGSGRHFTGFDYLIFILSGLTGLFLLYLWWFTHHSVTRYNLNLIWACPLNIIGIVWPGIRKYYFSVYSVVLSLFLLFFLFFTRLFDPALLPLILTLLIRSVRLSGFRITLKG